MVIRTKVFSIHCASLSGNPEVLRQLANNTACDLNVVDSEGRTAVHYAARNGCTDTVKMLVEEMKCNINCVDNTGITPLHLAAKYGSTNTIKFSHNQGFLRVYDSLIATPG